MPNVKITRFLRKLAYPFAKGIIFQTEMAKSFFSEHIQKKGVVLQNPVDATRIPEPYTGERKKVFAAVGRLEPQKNFPMLIKAFSEFHKEEKDYQLIIYGEGKERTNLEKLIKQLNLEGSVSLPGRNKDVLNAINEKAMKQLVIGRGETLGKNAYLTGKKLTDPYIFEEWKNVLFRV